MNDWNPFESRNDLHPVDSIIPPLDIWDRPLPRPTGLATFFRAIPGVARQFRDVPSEYWEQTSEDGSRLPIASISCPCSLASHRLRAGQSRQCACGRIYFLLGHRLMVAGSPVPQNTPQA